MGIKSRLIGILVGLGGKSEKWKSSIEEYYAFDKNNKSKKHFCVLSNDSEHLKGVGEKTRQGNNKKVTLCLKTSSGTDRHGRASYVHLRRVLKCWKGNFSCASDRSVDTRLYF